MESAPDPAAAAAAAAMVVAAEAGEDGAVDWSGDQAGGGVHAHRGWALRERGAAGALLDLAPLQILQHLDLGAGAGQIRAACGGQGLGTWGVWDGMMTVTSAI